MQIIGKVNKNKSGLFEKLKLGKSLARLIKKIEQILMVLEME